MIEINKKNVIWWVNHLFNNYGEHARRRGYTKQADEIEDARKTAIAAIRAYKLNGDYFEPCGYIKEAGCCEHYERQSNYTCDGSDLCASCKHNPEVEE